MFAPPPQVFGISIKVENIKKTLDFYLDLGICFSKSFEEDQAIYTYNNDGFLFIISEAKSEHEITSNLSWKFYIDAIDDYVSDIEGAGLVIIKGPSNSSEGRHLVFENYEGNIIELTCKKRET